MFFYNGTFIALNEDYLVIFAISNLQITFINLDENIETDRMR